MYFFLLPGNEIKRHSYITKVEDKLLNLISSVNSRFSRRGTQQKTNFKLKNFVFSLLRNKKFEKFIFYILSTIDVLYSFYL